MLVQTNGKAHSHPIDRLDSNSLKVAIETCIHPSAAIITNELPPHPKAAAGFAGGHFTVNHGQDEYVRKEDGRHTNTAESYFALLKRGVHSVPPSHLHRYWIEREVSDTERRTQALNQVEGKRLMYKTPTQSAG